MISLGYELLGGRGFSLVPHEGLYAICTFLDPLKHKLFNLVI